jgi:hypothetical protein
MTQSLTSAALGAEYYVMYLSNHVHRVDTTLLRMHGTAFEETVKKCFLIEVNLVSSYLLGAFSLFASPRVCCPTFILRLTLGLGSRKALVKCYDMR